MKRLIAAASLIIVFAIGAGVSFAVQDEPQGVRFAAVEIWLDTHGEPLAAYQIDFSPNAGDVKIVGVEGSEHAMFAEPPYYDPTAMMGERVIIADFSTAPGSALPSGKFRIATIHVQITGNVEPEYDVQLDVAATTDGDAIHVDITLNTGTTS
jgi:hypothetical protein